MTQREYHPQAVLRRRQVEVRTGLSKGGIYPAIQQGDFPRPINVGNEQSVGSNVTSTRGCGSGLLAGRKRKQGRSCRIDWRDRLRAMKFAQWRELIAAT